MNDSRPVVLVADDDEDIVKFVEINLRIEGFDVVTAHDGEEALEAARNRSPDLILLDVMMPKLDGFEVCKRLRADFKTRHISVIMLTAKSLSADKVVGLTAGADDYMIKPFDPLELIARVKSTLKRAAEMRAVNPLTGLPGNVRVQEEVARRIKEDLKIALMYVDLDNFKSFNDHYGFLRGDEAIRLLARCATEAVQEADTEGFLGHVGGDDFVALLGPDVAEPAAKAIIQCWDVGVVELYDPEDVARGYIEVSDRQNRMHRFPFMTVSVGIATNSQRPIESHWEAAEIATEMKHFAKRQRASGYAIDRRRTGDPESPGVGHSSPGRPTT